MSLSIGLWPNHVVTLVASLCSVIVCLVTMWKLELIVVGCVSVCSNVCATLLVWMWLSTLSLRLGSASGLLYVSCC